MSRPRKNQRIHTNSPLRKLRNNANLTQEQLAREIGIAVSTIRRWERGLAEPTMTLSQTKKFCHAVHHLRSLSFRKILMNYLILSCPKSSS
jgi:DNA-binding XRE family transcriptional regulator